MAVLGGLQGHARASTGNGDARRGQGHRHGAAGADAGVAIVASGRSNAEPVGRAPVLALVEMTLHVPPPTEGLTAGGAPMGTAVNVAMVLQRAGMFKDLAAFVAGVATHAIGCDGEGFSDRFIVRTTHLFPIMHHMAVVLLRVARLTGAH